MSLNGLQARKARSNRPNTVASIWAHIQKGLPHECWLTDLYGAKPDIRWKGKRRRLTRVIYEIEIGPIPPGLVVCHTCDTPRCSNPAHLFLGTQLDNVQDCKRKGRRREPKGMDHGMRKLNEFQILQIREAWRKGLTGRLIAWFVGVSEANISRIVNLKNWKSV